MIIHFGPPVPHHKLYHSAPIDHSLPTIWRKSCGLNSVYPGNPGHPGHSKHPKASKVPILFMLSVLLCRSKYDIHHMCRSLVKGTTCVFFTNSAKVWICLSSEDIEKLITPSISQGMCTKVTLFSLPWPYSTKLRYADIYIPNMKPDPRLTCPYLPLIHLILWYVWSIFYIPLIHLLTIIIYLFPTLTRLLSSSLSIFVLLYLHTWASLT